MISSLLHRKENVVLTAIEIIDQLGLSGLSTREIASRQAISEGTLFKHFRNKNEIILAVLEHYCKFDQDIEETIRLRGLQGLAAIRFFLDSLATYYENYPAVTAVVTMFGMGGLDAAIVEKLEAIGDNRCRLIREGLVEAQQNAELDAAADCDIVTGILIGSWRVVCLDWRRRSYGFSLQERLALTYETIFRALAPAKDKGESE